MPIDDGADILLIEDNPNDEVMSLHAFVSREIYNRIMVVRDGEKALEYIFCTGAYANRTTVNPKMILLDLRLPRVDGMEVLRRIRSDPRTASIPVVILTASEQDRDMVEASELGVNSYIVKPFTTAQFSAVAKRLGLEWLLIDRQANQSPLEESTSDNGHTAAAVSR